MIDPRPSIIARRLASVHDIVAVTGGKGGIGKTLVASTMALLLARQGRRVGLFDLDFSGPSTHIVLGALPTLPREEKGIVPPVIHGIAHLSVIHYVGDAASPLRGVDISNALTELLAVTRWGELDCLVLDMPPGIGDVALDAVRLFERARFLVLTTPSKLSLNVAGKVVQLLDELSRTMIGTIENMASSPGSLVMDWAQRQALPYLGPIRFDASVEDAIGSPDRLIETDFARDLQAALADAVFARN